MEKDLKKFIRNVKLLALNMARDSGKAGTHIGGGFSCLEIVSVLYGSGIFKCDPHNPLWDERDRFIASKAHCSLAHYSTLSEMGYIPKDKLKSYFNNGGLLAGRPWNPNLGLEFSGGSLGMGVSIGIGKALYAKRFCKRFTTYVLLGDGECNEGSVWEAFMSASQFKLDNFVAIIDYNNMQFDGPSENIMNLSPLKAKMEAFGFIAVECDGHNPDELIKAYQTSHEGKPLAIIAKTIKAHGIPSLENKAESHHASLSEEDYTIVLHHIEEESSND